jgi:hypothetical protein
MAEVKNSFLQSKMNKDLDDRLIPNGQYRDALNISVGKSESDNIGVLQNILGNIKLNQLSTVDASLTCIGIFMDNENNRIYQFLTNYTDLSPENITLCDNITPPTGGWVMKITMYDFNTNPQYKTLVSGTFLNFSTTNLVIGVNLIEGLLFWTDNRNQPRKININNALADPLYYTTETQISVAKYAPIDPISMLKKATVVISDIDTETFVYSFDNAIGSLEVGMTLVANTMPPNGYTIVTNVDENTFKLYTFDNTISIGDTVTFLTSTMTNKSDDPDWAGDPSFLEDKYVRFSYRFKFDDNEYSLIAPFTQIAYIPKQKGYFVNGDESSAYKSTVINWMENNVNNIELLIPLPDIGNNIRDSYKITKVDILYKESDALSVKVLDTIDYTDIRQSSPNNNIYSYSYQSQKPFKTLPDDQITRVYDNIPVRALAQEVAGNRVIYGNFYNTYSAPPAINYNTTVLPKSGVFTNFIEYPNHTVKQNRNYQVGFILADKFGRQSPVILSTIGSQTVRVGETLFGGSTLYAPYENEDSTNIQSVKNWLGNAIVTIVNNPIESVRDIQAGTPGLYAEPTSTIGFIVTPDSTTITDNSYQFTIDSSDGQKVPAVGDYMRGAYTDYVKVIPRKPLDPNPTPPSYFIRTSGRVNDIYLSNPVNEVDSKFAYSINEIGWYSYKIVVKQQQQEYYNVYLPGMLDGYPNDQTYGSQVTYDIDGVASTKNGINMTDFPVGEVGKTSHIVLINDNINKVPRDLVEVGPDQKLYRSSVALYGKVENSATILNVIADIDYLETNPLANSIIYKLEDNGYFGGILKSVIPGNGIQSDQANEPIDNPAAPPATIKNPNAWYANTVVVSNEIYSFEVANSIEADSGSSTITLQEPHKEVLAEDEIVYEIDGVTYSEIVDSVVDNVITLTSTLTVDIPVGTKIKVVRPTHGIITFSPPNWVVNSEEIQYLNYTVTKAENIQYFPTRKADIVTAIASAEEFNFLENDVNNIKGTAGLNFYQLQTKPSIGRVSVVNPIGVIGKEMVPFLSVYETTPVVSALQLFYETSSTGLISDLNYDVLIGYDGPIGFSDINFVFYENQDPEGTNEEEGEPDSKWITNTFTLLGNTGLPLTFIGDPILVSVFDNSSPAIDLTSKFGVSLETPLDPNTIRLFIKEPFTFDHNAPTSGSYTFLIKLQWEAGEFITFPVTGRLRNNQPIFLNDNYNTEISVTPGPFVSQLIVNIDASNGSFLENSIGMEWELTDGNETYFQLNSSTGDLFLINQSIPLGSYDLTVRIKDALSGGLPLNGGGTPYFGSLQDEINITVTVVAPRVNDVLVYETPEPFVWDNNAACSGSDVIGQGYAVYHIGAEDLSLVDGFNSRLPDITQTTPPAPNRFFQNYVNPSIVNGGGARPIGLTQGSLEWVLTNYGKNLYPLSNLLTSNTDKSGYISTQRQGNLEYILYYKPTINDTWVPVKNDNGFPSSININNPEWSSVVDLEMSLYHFTWLKTSNSSPVGGNQVIFNLPSDQPRPKVDDFIDLGVNGMRRIESVVITDDSCIVSLESTSFIVAIPANTYYRVARIPLNSLNEVYKQTSFTTSTPGQYCLVLKYTYRRDVNQYKFNLTVPQFANDARFNVFVRGRFPAPVVGDTVNYVDTGGQPRTATVLSLTWDVSFNAYQMRLSYATSLSNYAIGQDTILTFTRSFPNNLYCGTVDFYGKVQTRDVNVYEVNPPKYELALVAPGADYPYSRINSDRTVGFDYVYQLTATDQDSTSNQIELVSLPSQTDDVLESMLGPIVPGVFIGTAGYANWVDDPYFAENTQITNINTTTKVITISSNTLVAIPNNTKITIFSRPDSGLGEVGNVWASSNNGMNITQFYSNESLTNPWVPYVNQNGGGVVFRNSDRTYNNTINDGPITWSTLPPSSLPSPFLPPVLNYITIMPLITNRPFFSGLLNSSTLSIGPIIAAETAWAYNQRIRLEGQATAQSLPNPRRIVDPLARFVLEGVQVGDVVYNISDGKAALVTAIINQTTLELSKVIFLTTPPSSYILVPKIGEIENNEYLRGNLTQLRSI